MKCSRNNYSIIIVVILFVKGDISTETSSIFRSQLAVPNMKKSMMLHCMGLTNVSHFGTTKQGGKVSSVTLRPFIPGQCEFEVEILTYGATVRSIKVPGIGNGLIGVALGCRNVEEYEKSHIYMGCIVGRVANRIKNGQFVLSGKKYQLSVNNGPNHLHGGTKGFNRYVWNIAARGHDCVTLSHRSDDGDEGYPGRVDAEVTYKVSRNEPKIYHLTSNLRATCTKTTPINLANHIYFNLSGEGSGCDGLNAHDVQSSCAKYMPVDDDHLITGEIKVVSKTDYELTRPTNLGPVLDRLVQKQGYAFDNYFCSPDCQSNGASTNSCMKALFNAQSTMTGISMEVKATHAGFQFYTADYLNREPSKEKDRFYGPRSAFCVESQGYPDAINHPEFPSIVLNPGETYNETVQYTFYVPK